MLSDKENHKPALLVDACCGPCAIPLEELNTAKKITSTAGTAGQPGQDFEITFYVTNSNIHPFSEYVKRLQGIRQVAKHYKHNVIVDNYSPKEWLMMMNGMEQEPEGGKRCNACYSYRLDKAASHASLHGYKYFTTTLTAGTTKDAAVINSIGKSLAAKYHLEFIELDLKKNGGFLKGVVLSKKLGLYRQGYCGCVFSLNNPKKRVKKTANAPNNLNVINRIVA